MQYDQVWWVPASTPISCLMKLLWWHLRYCTRHRSMRIAENHCELFHCSPVLSGSVLALCAALPLVPSHPGNVRHGLPLSVRVSSWTRHWLANPSSLTPLLPQPFLQATDRSNHSLKISWVQLSCQIQITSSHIRHPVPLAFKICSFPFLWCFWSFKSRGCIGSVLCIFLAWINPQKPI